MTIPFYPLDSQTPGFSADASRPEPGADLPLNFDDLVRRVQMGDASGMVDLYECLSSGLRPYLARQLRPQDYRDKIHSIFVDVVVAIQHGQLREPERLMGFVRTVVRRQVAAHIDKAVQARREQMDLDASARVPDPNGNPEEVAIFNQKEDLVRRILAELSSRDREILTRFYLQEESQEEICAVMILTETQFRLLKSRAKSRFGELGKKKLAQRALNAICLRKSATASH